MSPLSFRRHYLRSPSLTRPPSTPHVPRPQPSSPGTELILRSRPLQCTPSRRQLHKSRIRLRRSAPRYLQRLPRRLPLRAVPRPRRRLFITSAALLKASHPTVPPISAVAPPTSHSPFDPLRSGGGELLRPSRSKTYFGLWWGVLTLVLSGSRDSVISCLRLRPGPLRRDRTRRITVTGHGYACTVT